MAFDLNTSNSRQFNKESYNITMGGGGMIPLLLLFVPGGLVEIGFQSIGLGDCSIIIDMNGVISTWTITILINHIHGKRCHHECISGNPIGFY